jgi:hypothetical protein
MTETKSLAKSLAGTVVSRGGINRTAHKYEDTDAVSPGHRKRGGVGLGCQFVYLACGKGRRSHGHVGPGPGGRTRSLGPQISHSPVLRFDCDHIALSTYRDECLASGLSLFVDLISSTYPPDIDLPGCEGMLLLELKFCPWQIKTRRLTATVCVKAIIQLGKKSEHDYRGDDTFHYYQKQAQ